MGMLIAGTWTDEDRRIQEGTFIRHASECGAGLGAEALGLLLAEPDRFHLITSLSCPWSHRTLIMHRLKGLDDHIPVHIAGGPRVEGYALNQGRPWSVPGVDARLRHLHQLYRLSDPTYTGRATVPVLWDSRNTRIMTNASATIMRAFDAVQMRTGQVSLTFSPKRLLGAIDVLNDDIDRDLSDAVYRAGFAERQDAYDLAVDTVFAMLDRLEQHLASRRFLFGALITEADWRLFTTLVRFDAVYGPHFRCTRRRLAEYPQLWGYARDLYSCRDIADTVDFAAILDGYYRYDGRHNPFGIVADLPDIDWRAPHDRAALGEAELEDPAGKRVPIEPSTMQPKSG